MGETGGQRFEHLPSLPGADGHIGSYLLSAQPLRIHATGYGSWLTECVSRAHELRAIGHDRLTIDRVDSYVYLSDPADESGRVTRFRVYHQRGVQSVPPWIDDQGVSGAIPEAKAGPLVEGLPAAAEPERAQAPPDPTRALGLFARLCDDGVVLACARASELAAGPRSEYLRRACVLGQGEASGSPRSAPGAAADGSTPVALDARIPLNRR